MTSQLIYSQALVLVIALVTLVVGPKNGILFLLTPWMFVVAKQVGTNVLHYDMWSALIVYTAMVINHINVTYYLREHNTVTSRLLDMHRMWLLTPAIVKIVIQCAYYSQVVIAVVGFIMSLAGRFAQSQQLLDDGGCLRSHDDIRAVLCNANGNFDHHLFQTKLASMLKTELAYKSNVAGLATVADDESKPNFADYLMSIDHKNGEGVIVRALHAKFCKTEPQPQTQALVFAVIDNQKTFSPYAAGITYTSVYRVGRALMDVIAHGSNKMDLGHIDAGYNMAELEPRILQQYKKCGNSVFLADIGRGVQTKSLQNLLRIFTDSIFVFTYKDNAFVYDADGWCQDKNHSLDGMPECTGSGYSTLIHALPIDDFSIRTWLDQRLGPGD